MSAYCDYCPPRRLIQHVPVTLVAPSAEDQAKFEDYLKKLKIAFPTAKAQTPEAAVKHLLKTIENVTIEASGTYVSG